MLTDEEKLARKKALHKIAKEKYLASEKGISKTKQYSAKYRAEHLDKIKPIAREYAKKYREENKEKVKKSGMAYRVKNRESAKENTRIWYRENTEKARASAALYYEKNREKLVQGSVEWQRKNPEKVAIRAGNYRARKKANSTGKLSTGLISLLMSEQGGKCAYCDADLLQGKHLDHFMPLALGGEHQDWNMQLLCPSCNCSKRHNHPQDFLKKFAPC